MRRRPSLDHLATFQSIVEQGSFSAAAQRAGLSQPAVSLQLRQLEAQIGVRLVERIGRKAKPTAAGTELLSHVARIEAAVSDMRDAMARHVDGGAGRLRFGTGATACTYLMPPILRLLRARFPQTEITVSTGNTSDIVQAVEENRIDVALVTLPAAGRMLDIRPVIRDEFVVIAPIGFPLAKRVTPTSMAALSVLLFEPGGNTRRIPDAWFSKGGLTLKPVMSLGSVEAIKGLVGAGLGCAIVPRMALGEQDATLLVKSLSPRLFRELAVVVRRDRPLQAPMKALIQALERAPAMSDHA